MSLDAGLPAIGFLLLFAAGLVAQVLSHARNKRQRLHDRFKTALNRHERINFVDLLTSTDLSSGKPIQDRKSWAARIFGYDPDRLDLYPVDPRVAIGAALIVSGLVASVASALLARACLLAAVPLCPVMSRMLFSRWRRKRSSALFKQLPDALAMIVRGVRVGIPVGEAIRTVSRDNAPPTATEFGRVADQVSIGMPIEDALKTMAGRTGLPEYRFFATALTLQGQTGGNLSETLEGLADIIRKRVAARDRGLALAAEARTSANVLSAMPALLFLALLVINPTYIETLLTGRDGHMILAATMLLLGLGVVVMKMLIQKSLS